MPLVYRLRHPAMLHGAPYLVVNAKGENASTGGNCGFGASSMDVESVVVIEPGGTATLPIRFTASREVFVLSGDPQRSECKSAGFEPMEPGSYSLDVALNVPGILPQDPLLRFEVVAPK